MGIPLTGLHKARVVEQLLSNLVGLQVDMRANATAHKAMAIAQSPDLVTLQKFVADCAAEYLRRFKWVIDLRADPIRKARMVEALVARGMTEADVVDALTPMRAAAVALRDAPMASYALIATACDNLLASVDAPDSLWPE